MWYEHLNTRKLLELPSILADKFLASSETLTLKIKDAASGGEFTCRADNNLPPSIERTFLVRVIC